MKTKVNYIVLALTGLLMVGGASGYFMWNKPHQDLTADAADFTTNPAELFGKFSADETTANQTYGNKIVELSGTVAEKTEVGKQGVAILLEVPGEMFGINCVFEPEDAASLSSVEAGSTITLRGKVDGFAGLDGMAFDVNLSRCVMIN